LNDLLRDLVHVAFIDAQLKKKLVRIAFRHLETLFHRLLQSHFLRRSEGRLWVLRAFRQIESFLKRLRPSRFFRCLESRKWIRMADWHLETSSHRLHQSRFLRRPEGWLWILRTYRLIKTPLKNFVKVAFFHDQNAENEFE
jgi:hypothetical protein